MAVAGDNDECSTRADRADDEAALISDLERGVSVGRYVVIERLGRGGMATVYRAYDPKLRRDVALKMLRRDLVDAVGESQIVAEAQAMAQLAHANVVVVYDVIAWGGGVVFAMELVEGGTLAQWLSRPQPRARILEVFVAAGRGLAAAHARGLVHRDFKPTNVVMGADEVPKVADFGLARPPDPDPSAVPSSDQQRDRSSADALAGTPRYMSPEQLAGGAIDARADQYAFCVALWEALAGRRAFDGDLEALRAAKLRTAPPLPVELRVVPAIAFAIARGLERDPALRWPDMAALLAEIGEQPLRARQRLRRRVAAAVCVVAAPLATWALWPVPRCRDGATALSGVWDPAQSHDDDATDPMHIKARARLDDYARAWLEHHRDACEATWIRGDQSVAQMDLRMACLWQAKAELGGVAGIVARADAGAAALEQAAELPPLDRCDDLERLEAHAGGPVDPQRAIELDALRQGLARTQALSGSGANDEAEPQARALVATARGLGDPSALVEAITLQGGVHGRLGRYEEAEGELSEALAIALASGDPALELDATNALVFHFVHEAALPERAWWLGVVAVGLAGAPEVDRLRAAQAHSVQGMLLRGIGRYGEAEAEQRRALALRIATLGEEHVQVAAARTNLGLVLYDRGDPAGAAVEHAAALEIWRQLLGDEHPRIATARGNLGNALESSGRSDEAVTELREALELRVNLFGPDHADVGVARNDLAIALTSAGQYGEAEHELVEALRIWTRTHGEKNRMVAFGHNNLGLALEPQGRLVEAAAAFARSVTLVEETMGTRHPVLPRILGNLGRVRFAAGRFDEAVSSYTRALALHREVVADDDGVAVRLGARLAEALAARGDRDAARDALVQAEAVVGRSETIDADDRGEVERVAALLAGPAPP